MSNSADKINPLINNGQLDQAVELAEQILQQNSEDVFCLAFMSQIAHRNKDMQGAQDWLNKALAVTPNDPVLIRNHGILQFQQKKHRPAIEAFHRLIQQQQHNDHDLLMLALSLAPQDSALAARLVNRVFFHNQALHFAYRNEQSPNFERELSYLCNDLLRMEKHRQQSALIAPLLDDSEGAGRLQQFLDIFHGLAAAPQDHAQQKPTFHHYPGLRAQPYYDADAFTWSSLLQQNSAAIHAELMALFADQSLVKPYIHHGVPDDDNLAALTDSSDWSSLHLARSGEVRQDILDACPVLKASLAAVDLPEIPAQSPEVFLSVLKGGTEIKPHHGLSNAKLTVHLGLDIPAGCELTVAGESRAWAAGELLIFDDTFVHSANNPSERDRFVLIFEIWHPDLSEPEHQGIARIMQNQNKFLQRAQNDTPEWLFAQIDALLQTHVSVH